MAKFSAEAFKKELQKKADKSASSKESTVPIAERAKEIMHYVVEEKVYNHYSPSIYKRRGENGGLLDSDNIVTTISSNHIIIDNIAEPNESIFGTPIRENPKGLLYEWMDRGLIDDLWVPTSFTVWWTGNRMGMTEDIANDEGLKNFAAKTIVKNMK